MSEAEVASGALLITGAIEVAVSIFAAIVMGFAHPPVTGAPWLVPATAIVLGGITLIAGACISIGGAL